MTLRPILCALFALWALAPMSAWAAGYTIYAAASLRGALDEMAEAWEAQTGDDLTLVYAGSSALARQVEAGANADIVFLANAAWMDHLQGLGALQPDTRRDVLTNDLVLIGAWHETAPLDLSDPDALAARLGRGRLALALTEAVPAGIYAREALEALGLWGSIADQVVETDNVRAALALVVLRAAHLGVVYATDARAEPRVAILAEFPPESHTAIVYPAALTANARQGAEALIAYLQSPLGRAIWTSHGFTLAGGR